MWFSKSRAAAVIPALVGAYLGLAASAHAVPLPAPPALLPGQQDGIFLTDGNTSVGFQTDTGDNESFLRLLIFNAPAGFTPGIVLLTGNENGAGGIFQGNISDALSLRLNRTTHRISAFFISDGAGLLEQGAFAIFSLGLPILGQITESGDWQDVSGFYGVGAGHFYVQSDVEAPEPASLAVLGTALAGLVVIRRRKRT
jgi:hypothetical protein